MGIDNEVHFYDGIGHSFLNPHQEDSLNREQAASLALERAFGFLTVELDEASVANTDHTHEQVETASTVDT